MVGIFETDIIKRINKLCINYFIEDYIVSNMVLKMVMVYKVKPDVALTLIAEDLANRPGARFIPTSYSDTPSDDYKEFAEENNIELIQADNLIIRAIPALNTLIKSDRKIIKDLLAMNASPDDKYENWNTLLSDGREIANYMRTGKTNVITEWKKAEAILDDMVQDFNPYEKISIADKSYNDTIDFIAIKSFMDNNVFCSQCDTRRIYKTYKFIMKNQDKFPILIPEFLALFYWCICNDENPNTLNKNKGLAYKLAYEDKNGEIINIFIGNSPPQSYDKSLQLVHGSLCDDYIVYSRKELDFDPDETLTDFEDDLAISQRNQRLQQMKYITDLNKKSMTGSSVKKLQKEIKQANEAYVNNEPIMDDTTYDRKIDELKKLNPKDKLITKVGAVPSFNKVKLPYDIQMGGTIKAKTEEEINKWLANYNSGVYCISDKIDGVSALLTYDKKDGVNFYLRGDGKISRLINNLLKAEWSEMIKTIKGSRVILRGELAISKRNWMKISEKYPEYKNSRNTVAGIVNSKGKDLKSDRFKFVLAHMSYIVYEVITPELSPRDQFKLINEKLPKDNQVFNLCLTKDDKIGKTYLSELLKKRVKDSKFTIDGLVIVEASKKRNERDSDGNPKYMIAYKENTGHTVTIRDVIWEISPLSKIVPVGIIDPTLMSGSTVTNISLYNAKYVIDNGIGPGAVVIATRSGDVIPTILQIITRATPKMHKYNYEWNENETEHIYKGVETHEMTIKRLEQFFIRLKVEGLRQKTIDKLYTAGYTKPQEFFFAKSPDDFITTGIQLKGAQNIYENITIAKNNCSLAQMMSASLCFQSLAEKRIQMVVDSIPDILTIKVKLLEKKMVNIQGFGAKSTDSFLAGLTCFMEFYSELPKEVQKRLSTVGNKQADKVINTSVKRPIIVFTGFRDTDMEEKFKTKGYIIGDNLTKRDADITTLVIENKESSSNKITNARKWGIKILTRIEAEKI